MSLDAQLDYIDNLPERLKEQLRDYTGSGYEDLNETLRQRKNPSGEVKQLIDDLDAIFLSVPPLREDITVYRGMKQRLSPELGTSYLSTSLDIFKARDFTSLKCCLFRIHVPAGSRVLPLRRISEAKYEDEVLLDRYGVLAVTYENIAHGVQEYTTLYIPSTRVIVTPTITKKELDFQLSASEWAERIIARANVEELQYFTPDEVIESLTETFDEEIPEEAYVIARAKLSALL